MWMQQLQIVCYIVDVSWHGQSSSGVEQIRKFIHASYFTALLGWQNGGVMKHTS
jgi:hypothetical protein